MKCNSRPEHQRASGSIFGSSSFKFTKLILLSDSVLEKLLNLNCLSFFFCIVH